MNKTSIEWVANFNEDGTSTEGYSVNPIRFLPHGKGVTRTTTMCQKISPGCLNCYAATIVGRFWPLDADQKFPGYTALGILSGEFVLDEKQLLSILKINKPAKVFWGDMTDIFQESVTDEMIDACFAVAALTPHLTHMFLTKRPERMLEYIMTDRNGMTSKQNIAMAVMTISDMLATHAKSHTARIKLDHLEQCFPKGGGVFPNVMLGTSAENQKYFDERIGYIDKLHHMKWKTFLSLEPLIGPIDVEYPKSIYPNGPEMCCNGTDCGCRGLPMEPPMVYAADLVIVGGESGPGARPMQTSWASAIQRSCGHWKIPYFFKQQGMWIDAGHEEYGKLPSGRLLFCDSQGRSLSDEEVSASTEDSDVTVMKWVGRERAGKTLYGKTYHEFPA